MWLVCGKISLIINENTLVLDGYHGNKTEDIQRTYIFGDLQGCP